VPLVVELLAWVGQVVGQQVLVGVWVVVVLVLVEVWVEQV